MYCETEMNVLNFGVKRSQFKVIWNNICWNYHCTGGGIQYATSRVKLDFLVDTLVCLLFVRLCLTD